MSWSGPVPTSAFCDAVIDGEYADFARPIFAGFANPPLTTSERDVAEAVWLAAIDASDRLRYPAGPDALALARAS